MKKLLLGLLPMSLLIGAYAMAVTTPPPSPLVVLGYNDLGMHCMNNDFSEICVLPPANTLRATVIRRGSSPEILKENVVVNFSIPGNTRSDNKVNFWSYDQQLFGVNLPANVGLFGYGLAGQMARQADGDWGAPGIPITPVTDTGVYDPYQLATITARAGTMVGRTQVVIPVSWEMNCNACHNIPGISVATDILRAHDRLHNTDLEHQKPVLCAKCHADPALGAAGQPGISSLSHAMHGAHAARMGRMDRDNLCYSCHPGPRTQCLRDIHKSRGMNCQSCHGGMVQVANPTRTPWVDEPRCGSCHNVPGHEYEQPGKLFRDSIGHNGVKCIACHGSPHAITPTTNPRDNVQAINYQGFAGTIQKCTVCHTTTPGDPFNHTRHD